MEPDVQLISVGRRVFRKTAVTSAFDSPLRTFATLPSAAERDDAYDAKCEPSEDERDESCATTAAQADSLSTSCHNGKGRTQSVKVGAGTEVRPQEAATAAPAPEPSADDIERSADGVGYVCKMMVSSAHFGRIIGRQGSTKTEIEKESGVVIKLPPKASDGVDSIGAITIRGASIEAVATAKARISAIVAHCGSGGGRR